jgi:hypothetical protein
MPISTQLSPFSISVKLSPPPLSPELVGAVYVGVGVAVTGAAAAIGATEGVDDISILLSIILKF